MAKDRDILAQIIKSWAQDHDVNYNIAVQGNGDSSVLDTGAFFSWLIKQTNVDIDLLSLLDRLELYTIRLRAKQEPSGLFCSKCQNFYEYAEANQPNGTLLCYSCRISP